MNKISLYCEYLDNPIGIDTAAPRFSWIYDNDEKGLEQTKYRIVIGTDYEKLKIYEDLVWDSGFVQSNETTNVMYEGAPLLTATTYYYRVFIEINKNEIIKSNIEKFMTGIIDENPWKAMWIGAPVMEQHTFWFRKEFRLEKKLKKAVAFVISPNYYELTVNGQKTTDSVLNNAWTDCNKTVLYSTYLITDQLAYGENAIGVTIGNGWHALRLGATDAGLGEHLFSTQFLIEYEDGTSQWIYSDLDGWYYTTHGPITFNSIYHGETYDARLEMDGWDKPNYDMKLLSSKWSKAVEFEPMKGKVKAQTLEPIKVVNYIKPVAIHELSDGSYSIDYGQNFAGWVRLKITGERGTKVVIKHAELENEDHSINPLSLRGVRATDTYILKGEGVEIYEPRFTYHGFRYIQIFGLKEKPSEDMFIGCVVRSAVDRIGSFKCDNDLLNKFYQNIIWTESSNLHGIPTDCPQRDERLGWLNDMTVRNEGAIYNFKLPQLYTKWLEDIKDTQGESTGAVTDTAPFVEFGQRPADPVSAAFLLIPWNLYCHYNDKKVILESYEEIKRWVAYLKRNSDNYIVRYTPMGDWAGPKKGTVRGGIGSGAVSAITPTNLMGTGYLYYDCCLLAKLAGVIGNKEDEEFYTNEANKVKVAFNDKFYNTDKKYYASNSQASNAFPLYLGMVDEDDKEGVLNNMVQDIIDNDVHLTTGNLCSRYIIEVLLQNGKEDLAYDLLTQTTYPSWGYMIKNNATTIWERWEHITEEGPLSGMASHNHPMNGSVGVSFHKHLAGINIDESNPGFKNIIIKPIIPSKMKNVEATVNTIKGLVKSSWRNLDNGTFELEINIPFNCTGEIYIPIDKNRNVDTITVLIDDLEIFKNGKFFASNDFGFEFIETNDEYIAFKTLSGSYNFRTI